MMLRTCMHMPCSHAKQPSEWQSALFFTTASCGATAVQVVPPVKTADFKVTVSTNREAVQVADLFADMVRQVGQGGGSAACGGPVPQLAGAGPTIRPLGLLLTRRRPATADTAHQACAHL